MLPMPTESLSSNLCKHGVLPAKIFKEENSVCFHYISIHDRGVTDISKEEEFS